MHFLGRCALQDSWAYNIEIFVHTVSCGASLCGASWLLWILGRDQLLKMGTEVLWQNALHGTDSSTEPVSGVTLESCVHNEANEACSAQHLS